MAEGKHENPMAVRSKSALAQALLRLMLQKPFDEISICEITSSAGLSRQTFYTNFNRREDILTYLLDGLFAHLATHFNTGGVQGSAFIIDYFMFWNRSSDFLVLLFKNDLGHLFDSCNRSFFAEAFPLDCPDEQSRYIRSSLAGLTCELIHLWLSEGEGLCLDDLSAVAENLLDGRIFQRSA